MGKKSGPSAPPPPDPTVVANAQSDANIKTAQEQQRLNLINTSGPNGTVNYAADPNAPGGYSQTTTLDPAQQAILDAQRKTELGATNIAQDQLGRVQGALATPLDTNRLPALNGGVDLSGVHPGQLNYSFDPGQHVQGNVGPANFGDAVRQASDAVYGQATSRLDPQFQTQEGQLRQQLADQGLNENDTAFKNAMDQFGRTKTDAYNQANYASIGAGLNAENQLFGQDVTQGQFHNQAAGQQYGQNQGQAAFGNQTEGQRFGEAATGAQVAMSNAQLQNQARQQGLQERAYIQNQPINQLTGLLSLGQVSNPNGVQYTPSQVGQTDVLGAYALNQQAQNAQAQLKAQQQSGLMGGLFSLGSAALMASDRRLKTNIRLVRRRPDGLGVYRFRYIWGGPERVGVMAQELKRIRPGLVVKRADGTLAVDYANLGAL